MPSVSPSSENWAMSGVYEFAQGIAQNHKDLLWSLNREIYENPEPHYEEFHAHDTICAAFEKLGYKVVRHAYGLKTAFEVEYGTEGPLVCYNAEYDALPKETGGHHHACGHNLIATSSIASFLILAELIRSREIKGRVRLLGTPAEESGGGKIDLLNAGAYQGVDACLMGHPGPLGAENDGMSCPDTLAVTSTKITFRGKEAHAGANPWDGVNALDALVAAYTSISMLRQQLPLTQRVHGIVLHGGERPNIIPGMATMEFYARADTSDRLQELCLRLEGCFNGAALATGCSVDFTWDPMYKELKNNNSLGEALTAHMKGFGRSFITSSKESAIGGSTDQGNVMHEVPGLHCGFSIPGPDKLQVSPHTPDFATAAGTEQAFQRALDCGKGLAITGFQVLTDADFYDRMWREHKQKA